MKIMSVGIDLAKTVFAVHGIDEHGKAVLVCGPACGATSNRIRGLLSEFGMVLPKKADTVRRQAGAALEDLPGWANRAIGDLLSHLSALDVRITEYDAHIKQLAQADERSRRLMHMPGIGPITASALLAAIGNGHD